MRDADRGLLDDEAEEFARDRRYRGRVVAIRRRRADLSLVFRLDRTLGEEHVQRLHVRRRLWLQEQQQRGEPGEIRLLKRASALQRETRQLFPRDRAGGKMRLALVEAVVVVDVELREVLVQGDSITQLLLLEPSPERVLK